MVWIWLYLTLEHHSCWFADDRTILDTIDDYITATRRTDFDLFEDDDDDDDDGDDDVSLEDIDMKF